MKPPMNATAIQVTNATFSPTSNTERSTSNEDIPRSSSNSKKSSPVHIVV